MIKRSDTLGVPDIITPWPTLDVRLQLIESIGAFFGKNVRDGEKEKKMSLMVIGEFIQPVTHFEQTSASDFLGLDHNKLCSSSSTWWSRQALLRAEASCNRPSSPGPDRKRPWNAAPSIIYSSLTKISLHHLVRAFRR